MEHSLKISNISHSQLSIVRHYGACIINGKEYIYNPVTDELVLKEKSQKSKKNSYISSNQIKLL